MKVQAYGSKDLLKSKYPNKLKAIPPRRSAAQNHPPDCRLIWSAWEIMLSLFEEKPDEAYGAILQIRD
jgi:hypothetical protein